MLPRPDPRPYIVQLLDNNPDFNFDHPDETLATVDTPAEALDLALDDAARMREDYRAECLRPPRLGDMLGSDLPPRLQEGARHPVLLALRFAPGRCPQDLPRAETPAGCTFRQRVGEGWVLVFAGREAPPRTPRWIEGCRRMTGAHGAQVVLHAGWDRIAVHLGEHLPSLGAIGLERSAWLLCADKGTFTKPE